MAAERKAAAAVGERGGEVKETAIERKRTGKKGGRGASPRRRWRHLGYWELRDANNSIALLSAPSEKQTDIRNLPFERFILRQRQPLLRW